MSTHYSIGQMNQLGDALEAAGFTPDDVTKLRSFPGLADIKKVLAGTSQIVAVRHVIDCDADPFVPENWSMESHKRHGSLEWNPDTVRLYLDDGQKNGKWTKGTELRKKLESQPVLNANVLDYLLAHQELVPDSWKDKAVFFWGTVYRYSDGHLYVRYLYWYGYRWHGDYRWLGRDFNISHPAACSQVS